MATLEVLGILLGILGLGITLFFFGVDKLDLFKGKFKKVIGIVYLVIGIFFIVSAFILILLSQ